MNAYNFIREIFKKYPVLLIFNIVALLVLGLFNIASVLSLAPIVDLYLHPDIASASQVTRKVVSYFEFFGGEYTHRSIILLFIAFNMAAIFLKILIQYLVLKTKYAITLNLQLETFRDFFNAKWAFFSGISQGTLINTFQREIDVVGNALGVIGNLFSNVIQVCMFLIVPFSISWQISIITIIVGFLFALPFVALGRINYKLGQRNTATSNETSKVKYEYLNYAKIVMGFGKVEKAIEEIYISMKKHIDVTIKSQTLGMAVFLLYQACGLIVLMTVLSIAKKMGVSTAEIAVLVYSLMKMIPCVAGVVQQKNSLDNFFPSYEQIKELRKDAVRLRQKSGEKEFCGFHNELLISNLTFCYDGREPIFKNLNISIPKRKMVAVVGRSGAGKSTLIDVIMGFCEPDEGAVYIDGENLQSFDIMSYRDRIGYVPQDSVLFNSSIKSNLLWAKDDAVDKEIIEACTQANIHSFINSLSEGYDTIVGDRGVRLSGGQIQRVALARAILRDPELLILDEATSSLDSESEKLIQQSIDRIAKNTTIVIIAHRLSTIKKADYVYVLEGGAIVEKGSYSELIRNKKHFSAMVQLQELEE